MQSDVADDKGRSKNPDHEAMRRLLSDYIRDFPNGSVRQVTVDLEDPLGSLQAFLGDAPDTAEVDEKIASGALPVGLAAEVHGRSYLEALLARDSGPVFAGTFDIEEEQRAIGLAHTNGVVIDLSAIVTFARLPETIRNLVMGHLPATKVVIEQHLDASAGSSAIQIDTGLSYRRSRGDDLDRQGRQSRHGLRRLTVSTRLHAHGRQRRDGTRDCGQREHQDVPGHLVDAQHRGEHDAADSEHE